MEIGKGGRWMRNKLVVIVVVLLIAVLGVRFVMDWILGVRDSTQTITESFERLEVNGSNALVEIQPTKEEMTTIEIVGKKKFSRGYLKTIVEDDTLSIKLRDKRTWVIFPFGYKPPTVKIYMPEKQYNSIRVKSDNGKIAVEGLRVKKIDLETDNGKIAVKDVEASSVRVETDNGMIDLNHVDGEIQAKTDTGLISMTTSDLDRSIDLKTDVGKISIQTDNEPTNATILAETDIGKINIFGTANNKTVFGNGEHLIKLKTDVGAILVR